MPLSYLRLLHLSLSKPSILIQHHILHAHQFNTRFSFSISHHPDSNLNNTLLFECLSQHRFQEARNLLDELPKRARHGRVARVVRWTSLLTKYTNCGCVDEARALFEIMPERNIVTYNAMLSGYVQSGRLSEASLFFDEMPERNVVSWTSMLYGLAYGGRIVEARRLFEVMPERNVFTWNSMLAGLIRNGSLEEARRVFNQMPDKNIVSYNTMIAGYAENCQMEDARVLFDEMQYRNVITWTSMIAGYCRISNVDEGYFFFRNMPERNIISWTAMIGGFAWNGFHEKALMLFLELKGCYNINPNAETFISLAYACAGIGLPYLGKQLHAWLIINRWDDYDDFDGRISKSLIHMYSTLGLLDYAHRIFIKTANLDSVQCCNYMLNGYIRIGQLEKAENLFDIIPMKDKISWSSMINGYFSVGEVSKACSLFRVMPERDVVAWTAMVSGHVRNENFSQANRVFSEMRVRGASPLNTAYSVLLGAAGAMAHLDQGRQLHCLHIKTQHEGHDLITENSLISMYTKCGEIDDAYSVFSRMVSRDLVSWNSMIIGFSDNGFADESLRVYKAMLESCTHPNSVTFLGVLSACSNTGRVSQGWELFNSMTNVYSIQPSLEHYVSIINLLGRAGKLREAEEFVLGLPFEPEIAVWGALLGVCGIHHRKAHADIAKSAAKRLIELDPLNAPAHVVLCNIYARNGLYVEERRLRKEMGMKGIRKVPGCSWILIKGRVHAFLSGDKSNSLVDMLLLLFSNQSLTNIYQEVGV